MQFVAIVAKQLWLRRNMVIFGGDFLDPKSLIHRATEQVDACVAEAQRMHATEDISRPPLVTVWQKPGHGWLKLN